jgi:hypothetical protein
MTLQDLDRRLLLMWRCAITIAGLFGAVTLLDLGPGWRLGLLAVAWFGMGVAWACLYAADRLEEVDGWLVSEEGT